MWADTPHAEPTLCAICPAAMIRPLCNLPRCGDPSFVISAPLWRSIYRKNKNPSAFATFLRLGTLLCLRNAENCRFAADHLRFYGPICDCRDPGQSLIAKKLQHEPIFCFEPSGRLRGNAMDRYGARIQRHESAWNTDTAPWSG